jgi:hypothetical protein
MPYPSEDEEYGDPELPEPDTHDGAEAAVDTVPCPFCQAEVFEDAEWCPHCRNYLFYDDSQQRRQPWWVVAGVVVSLLVVLYWIFH